MPLELIVSEYADFIAQGGLSAALADLPGRRWVASREKRALRTRRWGDCSGFPLIVLWNMMWIAERGGMCLLLLLLNGTMVMMGENFTIYKREIYLLMLFSWVFSFFFFLVYGLTLVCQSTVILSVSRRWQSNILLWRAGNVSVH